MGASEKHTTASGVRGELRDFKPVGEAIVVGRPCFSTVCAAEHAHTCLAAYINGMVMRIARGEKDRMDAGSNGNARDMSPSVAFIQRAEQATFPSSHK